MSKANRRAPLVERRVFQHWSIMIPWGMDETFVEDGSYWHARDGGRSVSLTSWILNDQHGRPVKAREILDQLVAPEVGPREQAIPVPNALPGWAKIIEEPDLPVADHAISGILVVDGNALIVTVTSDDLGWARSTWRSICHREDVSRAPRLARALEAASSGRSPG